MPIVILKTTRIQDSCTKDKKSSKYEVGGTKYRNYKQSILHYRQLTTGGHTDFGLA